MSGDDGRAGFTLVETLVAFALLALTVAGAVRIVGETGVAARRSGDRAIAQSHGRSELARLDATGLAAGNAEGRFADGFAWRRTATARAGSEAAMLLDVELTVTAPAGPSVRLRTVLPASMAAAELQ